MSDTTSLDALLGKDVVLDTNTTFLYLGRLEAMDDFFVTLTDCDVHDMNESTASAEYYILEARKHGITKNRHRVYVRACQVVSMSLLDEVVMY